MKYWKGLIAYLVAFILQPFLYNLFPGIDATPNLILCLTAVLVFIYEDNVPWMAFGVGFALAMDFAYGLYIGIGMMTMIIVILAIMVFKHFFNVENLLNSVILSVVITWVYATVYWLIAFIGGSPYTYWYALKSLPWQLVFNAIIFMLIYLVMIRKVTTHKTDRYFG